MAKKISLFLAGIITGLLAYLGVRVFSRGYRSAKKELQYLDGELNSIETELDMAEELQSVSFQTINAIRDRINRERQVVESLGAELKDDANIIAESERRLTESEIVIAQCRELLGGASEF